MKKEKTFLMAAMALNILLIIGTATFFASCGPKEDGSFMHCHTACRMVQLSVALMIAVDLFGSFLKNRKVQKAILVMQIAVSVITMLIPGKIISLCMMPQMHCRLMMRPFVITMEVLVIVVSSIGLLISSKEVIHE